MRKVFFCSFVLAILAGCLAGCGQSPDSASNANNKEPASVQTPAPVPPAAPVTLKVYPRQPMTVDDFTLLIADPVKKKYPNITMELMDKSAISIEDLVASKEQVDLYLMWNGEISSFKELGIFEDITPLLKKANFDLGRLDPGSVQTLKTLSDKGEVYGLTYNVQLNALYYNKDIFDKFGVAYPKDGMTWNDAVELTKRTTRTDGGVQYSGLGMDGITRLTYPLSLIPVDAKTNQASLNSDLYRKAFTIAKQIYSIPGNEPKFTADVFLKEKKQAMFASVNYFDQLSKITDMNWDVAQFPSYKETPNVYGMYDLHVITISRTSKYQEEAMKALSVFFSDEVQKISTRKTGRVSALTNPEIQKEFGAENPELKGKHLQSIFKSKSAFSPAFSKYQSKGTSVMKAQSLLYLQDKKDLNTMIRDAEEEINAYIKTQQ